MDYRFSDRISPLKASAIREILKFTADPSVISFAAGNPAPEAFPVETIREISAKLLEQNPILALQYSISEGYPALRDLLKDRLKKQGIFNPDRDELMIVSGAQQGVELSCKVLCNEGDVVISEAPSFIGSLNAFRSLATRLVGVPLEEDGVSLTALEAAMQANPDARLFYIIPNFQNPSGITTSEAKRHAVYALAKRYGVLLLEDNPYGDLRFSGEDIPAIKTLDEDGIVLYCGSFSKVLAPGLRVGYLVAPKEIISKVVVAKQVSDVHTNIWAQALCERFLATQDMDAHLAHLREIYRHKCALMQEGLRHRMHPAISFTKPEGGLFLWGTLPNGVDMMDFCRQAVARKVAIVPGSAFMMQEEDATQSFRLNFSTPTDEQIERGTEILGELSHEILK